MQARGTSAVVSGGASGLGLATARRLLDAGAGVVLLDLAGSAGERVAAELGPSARFVPGDVTDEASVEEAVDTAESLAPLRIAVACAGIGPPGRVLGRDGVLTLEHFTRTVTVNLVGTFNLARLAAARIARHQPLEGERGVIVCTASVAAFEGQVGQVSYAASKGGVVAMTLPLARDLAGVQIRVVTIAPGLFDTPLLASLPAQARASLAQQVPHPHRLGRPDEFAQLVLHVVANPMLNGAVIRLDGAIRMAPR